MKKVILFSIMGSVVIAGASVGTIFIIKNANRSGEENLLDYVQGTWEIYSYDTQPMLHPKELPAVDNQFFFFDSNHLTYYVNGNVTLTGDITMDGTYMHVFPSENYVASFGSDITLKYTKFSIYNFALINESSIYKWDLIKHRGSYSEVNQLSNEKISGDWNVKYRSHNADSRIIKFDTTNNIVSAKTIDGVQLDLPYTWSNEKPNLLSVTGMGQIKLYSPNDNVLFLVQYQDSSIWELHR